MTTELATLSNGLRIVTDRIDSRVLSQAGPRLKLIASFGTGVDHIDLDTARQRGITVTNTPGVLTEDTADMSMALVLARCAVSPRPVVALSARSASAVTVVLRDVTPTASAVADNTRTPRATV